jgi:hypothetical protein
MCHMSRMNKKQKTINKQSLYFDQEPVILSDYNTKNYRALIVLRDFFNTNSILIAINAFTVYMSILYPILYPVTNLQVLV